MEGYLAAGAAWKLARREGVSMPITEQCYRVCYEGQPPEDAIRLLMGRPKRHEGNVPGCDRRTSECTIKKPVLIQWHRLYFLEKIFTLYTTK